MKRIINTHIYGRIAYINLGIFLDLIQTEIQLYDYYYILGLITILSN